MLTVQDPSKHDWANMSLLDIADGNSADVFMTWKIFQELEKQMIKLGLMDIYDKLLSPLTTRFSNIERRGLGVNMHAVDKMEAPLREDIVATDKKIREIPKVPKDINLASSKQLVDLLFEDEGGFLLYPPNRSKKTNKPSADGKTIEELMGLIEAELERRNE